MRYRLIILLLAPLIIGLVPQVKPVAILGGIIAILAPQSIIELLKLIYGARLMPETTVTARGSQAIVRVGNMDWRFYKAYPRLSIEVHREDAIKALNGLIATLPLDSTMVSFVRIGSTLYIGSSSDVSNILNRYFLLEPVTPQEAVRLLGNPMPLTRSRGFMALLIITLIASIIFYGLPRQWLWVGAVVGILLVIALLRAGGGLSLARYNPFRSGMVHSDARHMSLEPSQLLAYAERNARRDFALTITGSLVGRENYASELARAIDRYQLTGRGMYAPRIDALQVTHKRVLAGEVPIRFSILGDIEAPGMRVGFGAVHWLMEPELNGLSMDVTAVPVFYGGSLIAQSDEVVVTVGRDEYGSEVKIGLNTAPSPHALIVGPTGSGKSWSTVSLMMRAITKYGVRVLIIDPQGEYPSYLKSLEPIVINVREAFIDWLEPVTSPIAWADLVSQAVRHAYADAELARLTFNDLVRLYGSRSEYLGLHESLDWLVVNGEAKRVWDVARDLEPTYTARLSQLMNAPNPVIITLRDVMVHREYVSLLMQVLLARAYHEGLAKPFTERVENILAFDEAYLIIESPILELVVRGVRKMGFGVWVITQSLGDVKPATLQNFGFSLLLQGPAPYAESVGKVFLLGEDNVRWLSQANNPRVFGGEYTPGILIYPPRPRRVFVRLEPVKG
jgi:hypothetical protein